MFLTPTLMRSVPGGSRVLPGLAEAYEDAAVAAGTNVLQALLMHGSDADWRDANTLRDLSRNGTLRTVQPGRCYDFDGTDDTISCTTPFSGATSAFSVSAWVKLDTAANFAMIVAWSTSGEFDLRFSGTTRQPQAAISGGPSITAASAIALNTWTHLCATYSAGTLNLYVNGVAETPAGPTGSSVNFTGPMYIGSRGGSQFWHDGKIFDVRAYSRVLTQGEVTALASKITARSSSLATAAHYKLDDNSTSTARDASGAGGTGTAAGSPATYTGADVPWSWQNEVGYSDGGGGSFIPRNEAIQAQDVDGGALDYAGEAPNDGAVKTSPCVTLNASGSDDYIGFTSRPVSASASTLTVSIWAYFAGTATFQMIISDANNTELRINASEQVELILTQSGESNIQILPAAVLSTGAWHHFLFTFNSGAAELFVDGVSAGTASDAAAGWDTFRWDNTWRLGQRTAGTFPLLGRLRNMAVWDRVLTAAEIATLYANGDVSSGLLAHWPMCEQNALIIYDTVGGINGTASGATSAQLWANTQDDYHYALRYGATAYIGTTAPGLVTVVPNKLDGTASSHSVPASTALVRNFAKGRLFEQLSTSIDCTNGVTTAPWTSGRSIETAYVFGTDRTTPKYVKDPEHSMLERIRAGTATQWTVYGTSLSANGVNQWQDDIFNWVEYRTTALTKTNRGAPGEASSYGLTNIGLVTGDNPDVVTLEWCMNDAYTPYSISVAQAQSNHEDMIDAIWAARPNCRIILLTTNGTTNVPNRPNILAYYQMYRDLVVQYDDPKLTLVDWNVDWAELETSDRATYLTYVSDEIHPNQTGSALTQVPLFKEHLMGYGRRLVTFEA